MLYLQQLIENDKEMSNDDNQKRHQRTNDDKKNIRQRIIRQFACMPVVQTRNNKRHQSEEAGQRLRNGTKLNDDRKKRQLNQTTTEFNSIWENKLEKNHEKQQ